MRLLADECADQRLVAALRRAGHEVRRIPARSGLSDLEVAATAMQEDLVLLTQDKDFGRLGSELGQPRSGVILVRCRPRDIARVAEQLVSLLKRDSEKLRDTITVLDGLTARRRAML